MFYLIVSLIIILLLICVCVWLKVDNIKTNEAYYKLKISQQKQEAAWVKHCKALRKQYQNAIFKERNKQPTVDVVEVVRCQDCSHCTAYRLNADVMSEMYLCDLEIAECKENFYCAYGERKQNERTID